MGTRPRYSAYLQIKTILLLLTICFPLSAIADTFVVDDNYDGTNSSSACEQPAGAQYFSTIATARVAAAATTAPPAHTIRICPSTYTENNSFFDTDFVDMSIEGTSTDPSQAVINGVGTGTIFYLRTSDMKLKNLTLSGGRFGVTTLTADNTHIDNVIVNSQSEHAFNIRSANNKISNTTIDNIAKAGINADSLAANLTIESTTVNNTTSYGIYLRRGGVTLKDVTVSNSSDHGVYLNKDASYPTPQSATIDNLTISNTTLDGLLLFHFDASAAADKVLAENVTINNAGRYGM